MIIIIPIEVDLEILFQADETTDLKIPRDFLIDVGSHHTTEGLKGIIIIILPGNMETHVREAEGGLKELLLMILMEKEKWKKN
jgi:hypothetical protein